MNDISNEEFDCHFLDEGFTAKDILDQKINEVSSSVSIKCMKPMLAVWLWQCWAAGQGPTVGPKEVRWNLCLARELRI